MSYFCSDYYYTFSITQIFPQTQKKKKEKKKEKEEEERGKDKKKRMNETTKRKLSELTSHVFM